MPHFEDIPNIQAKKNRYKIYSPSEDFDPLSYAQQVTPGVFHRVYGPIKVEDSVALERMNPDEQQQFDLLGEYTDFGIASYRGKRREHAFILMAQYAKRNVTILKFMLDKQSKLEHRLTLNYLKAFVLGLKFKYEDGTDRVMYTTDRNLMSIMEQRLYEISLRTAEVSGLPLNELPPIPQFGGGDIDYRHFLSANDWEIVAGTYCSEVEAYLRVSLLHGYDFKPPAPPSHSGDEDEDEEEDGPVENVPFTPGKAVNPEVAALLDTNRRTLCNDSPTRNLGTPTRRRSPSPVSHSPRTEDFKTEGAKPQAHNVSFELPNLTQHNFGSWGASGSGYTPLGPSSIPRRPELVQVPSFSTPELGRTAIPAPSAATTAHSVLTIPSYQNTQIDRVYGKPAPEVSHLIPHVASERLSSMFKRNPYNTEGQGDSSNQPNPPPVAASTLREPLPENSHSRHHNRARFVLPTMTEEHPVNDPLQNIARPDSGVVDPFLGDLPHHSSPTVQRISNDALGGDRRPPSGPPGGSGWPPNGPPRPQPPSGGGGPPGYPPSGGGFPPGQPPDPPDPGGGPSGGSEGPPSAWSVSSVSDPGHDPNQPPDPNPPGGNGRPFPPGPPYGGDPSNPPGGGGGGDPPGGGPPGATHGNSPGNPPAGRSSMTRSGMNKWINTMETHFDTKLKPDIIPTWNGDENLLGRWFSRINDLAERSASVFIGLGDIVPSRFTDSAANWWYSLPTEHRALVTVNWDTLKDEIRTYWMNQTFLDKVQTQALRARYREKGYETEMPSAYYIRKYELISLVYNFTAQQIMSEVLHKAPVMWSTVINPRNYTTLAEFQTAIKYQESVLIRLVEKFEPVRNNPRPTFSKNNPFRQKTYKVETRSPRNPFRKKPPNWPIQNNVKSYAVGWSPGKAPEFPKDDSIVSKGRTPESYGARGCIFCGSKKHWDKECSHAKSNMRKARAAYAEYSADALHAEAEYENAYQEKEAEYENAYQEKDNSENEEYDLWENNEDEMNKPDSEDSEDVSDESDF